MKLRLLVVLCVLCAAVGMVQASYLGDVFAQVTPVVGLVAENGDVDGGLMVPFPLDTDGDLARQLRAYATEWWGSGSLAKQACAVPTMVGSHLIRHVELTIFAAGDMQGVDTGARLGLGYRVGPEKLRLHVAAGYGLGELSSGHPGAPTWFMGIEVSQ